MKKMRRIVSAALVVALAGTVALAAGNEGNRSFNLLRAQYREGENCLVSPLSLNLALGMMERGAQGETLVQLDDYLGGSEIRVPEGIRSANAVFAADGFVPSDDWKEAIAADFDAEMFVLNGTEKQVNAWVSEKTDGMIDALFSPGLADIDGMIAVNALAMKAEWSAPFDPDRTYEEPFFTPHGEKPVEMMHIIEPRYYAEHNGTQFVRLPYKTGDLVMWIAMPAEGGTAELLDLLEENGMDWIEEEAEVKEVILSLPKFDVAAECSMTEMLIERGVDVMFSDSADFSGISEIPIRTEDIIQKVRVKVDENGTEAAAVTAIMNALMAAPDEDIRVEMKVNRPFMFVIEDKVDHTVCFAGVINDPAGE